MPTRNPSTVRPTPANLVGRVHAGRCHYDDSYARCPREVVDLYTSGSRSFPLCMNHIGDAGFCESTCGRLIFSGYRYEVTSVDGSRIKICRDCMNRDYVIVYCCDTYVPRRNAPQPHRCVLTRPRSSGYRPNPMIFNGGDEATGDFYGIELEVGVPGHHTQEIEDIGEGLLYVKSDCSVSCANGSSGVEIVSHPMTLEYMQNNYPMRLLRQLVQWGNVNRSCGLHVHASRNQFKSVDHLADCSYLWNSQREAVRALARRVSTDYAAPMDPERAANLARSVFGDRDRYGAPRYALLNLQNTATVEFRGFAATLRPERLLASVEMVAATIKYTEIYVGTPQARNWEDFGGWLFKNAATYPNLLGQWFERQMPDLIVGSFARDIVQNIREINRRNNTRTIVGPPNGPADANAPHGYTATGRVRQRPLGSRRAVVASANG